MILCPGCEAVEVDVYLDSRGRQVVVELVDGRADATLFIDQALIVHRLDVLPDTYAVAYAKHHYPACTATWPGPRDQFGRLKIGAAL